MISRDNHCFLDQRGLGGVLLREHETAARARCPVSHRQCSTYRAQFSGQGEFASPFVSIKFIRGNLTCRRKYAQRDRQVEAAAFLGQIGGSEVDRDVPGGKFKLRVLQRCPYPVLAFLHFRFRQPTMVKLGKPLAI